MFVFITTANQLFDLLKILDKVCRLSRGLLPFIPSFPLSRVNGWVEP